MKKKIFLLLAIVAVLALAFAACEDVPVVDETTVSTEAPTDPTTAPATDATTDPATDPATNPATDPTTDPATNPATDTTTDPATDATTDPATEPATEPVTEPVTEPATEPVTEPGHEHTWADATCTSPKSCSSCGATEGKALGHDVIIDAAAVAATCTAAGNTEGKHCSRCDYAVAQETIPALGHEFYADVCKHCGGTLPTYPAWDADKAIVKNQSFDALYYDTNRNVFFTEGQSAGWNRVAAVPATVTALTYWGWAGYMGVQGTFGYQIDCNEAVFDAGFAYVGPDHDGIIAAAKESGADSGIRMQIILNTAGLTVGVHTVNILYKDASGNVVGLCNFKLFVIDDNGSQATNFYSASDLAAMGASNATVEAADGCVHVASNGGVGSKDDAKLTFTSDGFSDIIVIKYKTNAESYGSNYDGYFYLNGNKFIGNRKNSDNWFEYYNDGEWHYLILNLRKNKAGSSDAANVDVNNGAALTTVEYVLFDYADNSSGKKTADEYIDIAYVAFY